MKYLYKSNKLFEEKAKNHFHSYHLNIISQPELSNLLFYDFENKQYTDIKCKTIWNKIIRREILLKTIDYLGEDYYNDIVITADDTLFNIISLQFANNFSNINISGYMYSIREVSVTHGSKDKMEKILFDSNYFLYNKKLYKYIKDFNKNRNILFHELERTNFLLLELMKLNESKKIEVIQFYKDVLEDKNISDILRDYLNKFLL